MDFLRRIEDAIFPLEISTPTDLRNAAVLAAAELIEAELTPPDEEGNERPGMITKITPLGRAALRKMREEKPASFP
jgi:hypothetical protein